MFYVYLIRSQKDHAFYIGYTTDLRARIQDHNSGKTRSIKHKLPFSLMYYEAYRDKTAARKREIELKNNSYQKEQLIKRVGNAIK